MALSERLAKITACRLIVVGGHTRSIGKTQLVCQLIAALPAANWIAGKITQYGHGVCATNGHDCDCAPTEHVVALDWETEVGSGTDSARFLLAGAVKSFWLRTKQGYLAEGMPLLREALSPKKTSGGEGVNVIVESNSLLQFVKPSLYVSVLDPGRTDFKKTAQTMLDRADALVFRQGLDEKDVSQPPWLGLPSQLMRQTRCLLQREGEPLPQPLLQRVQRILQSPPTVLL